MLPARSAVEIAGAATTGLPSEAERTLGASSRAGGRLGLAGLVSRKLNDYVQLTKIRLSLMVLASGLVGFWLASGVTPDPVVLVAFATGTLLVIAGANAFNQIIERAQDGIMQRTSRRPLPAGRMGIKEALTAASVMSVGGLGLLLTMTRPLTFALGLAALLVYVLVYTPLKRVSQWSTPAGAVAGAIPPLMGWSAVHGEVGAAGWALFAIVFLWQFPHSWAVASTYREDYHRAGYCILPLLDEEGRRTRRQMLAFCLALLAVSLLPGPLGVAGPIYGLGALALGIMLLAYGIRFGAGRSRKLALQLLLATLVYMPVLLVLLVLDRRGF